MEELKTIGGLAQLGSFGVLVFLIIWMTKAIPRFMDGLNKERANTEQARILVAGEHRMATEQLIAAFNDQTKYERSVCEKHHEEILERIEKAYALVREVKHEVANISQSRAMEIAHQEAAAGKRSRGQQ